MEGRSWRKGAATLGMFALLFVGTFVLIRCGGTSNTTGMGSAYVTISDPPSNTDFSHVWVTIDDVSANISGTSDAGWQSLVSSLDPSGNPIQAVQVDLMNLPAQGQCLLAQLGSTQSLPAGDYQQIRLMLVANNATSVNLNSPSGEPTSNQCASVNAWNCVVTGSGTAAATTALNLSSEAQTGLKIPPGQVMGGPIHVANGQSVDINIDFASDRSIVAEGNGQYRLDPVLVAYQSGNSSQGASANLTGISGQVLSGTISGTTVTNGTPIGGANIALELDPNTNPTDGSTNVDLITNWLTTTDSNGNFDFCPLPTGPFDVVASAGSASAPSYNATIVTGVPNGTQVAVPLLAEAGTPNTAATLSGLVTATSASSNVTSITANVYALQQATSSLEFAVPLLANSNPEESQLTVSCTNGTCTTTAPLFSLVLPASNPLVGTFAAGNISWTAPTGTGGTYKVEATCTGSSSTVATFSSPTSTLTAGTSTTLLAGQPPQLTNCE